MYNLFKKIIGTCALAGVYAYSPCILANTYSVQDIKFSMSQPDFSDLNQPAGANIVGSAPWGTIVDGVYQGTNTTTDIVDFKFFGETVYVYTAATNQGSVNTPAGTITGGPAPTFDLDNLTADMSSWFAQWSGTEFLQGNNNNFTACVDNPNVALLSSVATMTDNFDGTYRVDWNSCIDTVPFKGQIGFWQLTLRCDEGCATVNPGLADTLSATQGGQITRVVTTTGGDVNISSPLDGAANHTFAWKSETDASITDIDGVSDDGNFRFDANIAPGNYSFTSTYTDDSNFPASVVKGIGRITIKVVASAAGIDINDSNNNGIINEYDTSTLAATQLEAELSNGTSYVLQSDKGIMKLGQAAFCAGKAARINLSEMALFAGVNCTAITDSADAPTLIDAGKGGYHDFELHGLAVGDVAQIVIPLNTTLPSNAVYRKYNNDGDIWGTFITGNGDALASTSATSTGVCPPPGDAAYTNGLTEGDNCIQLTITDGGINDSDGTANGQILDPGTIAKIRSGTEAVLGGCSLSSVKTSSSEHSDWFILAAFIGWLGFMARRQKRIG